MRLPIVFGLAVLGSTTAALAQGPDATTPPTPPAPEEPTADVERPPPADEVTAADVEGAPPPGDESGRADPIGDGDSTARKIGRVALFIPRGVFEVVLFPVRASVYAADRYDLAERWRRLFYNEEGTIGLHPMVQFQNEYGFNVGARFDMRFGKNERFTAFGAAGGRFSEIATGTLRTEQLDRRLELTLDARFERRPQDRFFGIGNGDEIDPPPMPIDALTADVAVDTRYRRRIATTAAIADLRIAGDLYGAIGGAMSDVERGVSDSGPPIDMVFTPDSLIDFDSYRFGYAEAEVRWDSRDRTTIWEPDQLRSQGSLVSAFAGRVALDQGEGFWRYGADLQHYYRMAKGPRVLAARLYGEAVTGDRDQVPFTLLPYLGGQERLRGYATERFRDRLAAVGSLQYEWDLSKTLQANLFVDAGRVWESYDDLTLDGLRVGYGIGVEAHTDKAFIGRAYIATSIDGGVFASVAFSPSFDITPRVRRR